MAPEHTFVPHPDKLLTLDTTKPLSKIPPNHLHTITTFCCFAPTLCNHSIQHSHPLSSIGTLTVLQVLPKKFSSPTIPQPTTSLGYLHSQTLSSIGTLTVPQVL